MTPQIKASYFAGTLRALDALGELEGQARERLSRIVKGSAGLSGLDWVPLAWDVELNHVVADLGGVAAVRALNRRALEVSLDGALVRPFISAAVSLLGPSPRVLQYLPRAWAAGSRDLGALRLSHLDADGGTLVFEDLPPEVARDAIWLESICGVVEGICDTVNYVGMIESPRMIDGAAVYALTWRKKAERR